MKLFIDYIKEDKALKLFLILSRNTNLIQKCQTEEIF
jgi:hypothetical protein